MLKTIHKYQRSIILYFVMIVVVLSMFGFGVDTFRQKDTRYAIRIDDQDISYLDFYRYRRNIEDYYRSIYGAYYSELAQSKDFNLNQQTIDQIIPAHLQERFAKELGLHVGSGELYDIIKSQLPGGQFNRDAYANLLRQQGMSAREFEAQLSGDALRSQLRKMATDLSRASKAEAAALLERDETAYAAEYLEFDPEAFIPKVPAPQPEVLQTYYQDHAAAYERPARVAYQFVVFDPEKQLDIVAVTEDDIELYYTDHEDEYLIPARAKLRAIRFTLPAEADEAARAELKKKAEQAQVKAAAGEDFKGLVEAYSDDMTTKFNGGDLGWVTRGQANVEKAVVSAGFKLKAPGVAELVETPKAFFVVKVDEYQPEKVKPLAEVRSQVEQAVRKQEAPAWVADRARTLHEEWITGGKPLEEFAGERGLALQRSEGLQEKDKDPAGGFKGLTAQVMTNPDEQKQIVEAGDKLALVQIAEHKEAEVPPLAEVQEQVSKDYAAQQAKELARAAAAQLVSEIKEKKFADLKEAGKQLGLEVKTVKDQKRLGQADGPFGDAKLRDALFGTHQVKALPGSSYESGGKYYVFQTSDIQKPDMSKLADKVESYQERASQENSRTLLASLTNDLKMQAEIDVAVQAD